MIKGKDLLGRPVVAVSTGERVERVEDVVFDHQANEVLALLVDEGGWFSSAKAVPFTSVRSFGEDAIMIGSPDEITTTREDGRLKDALDSKTSLLGLTLMTSDGRNLGKIADVLFDEQNGKVVGYEVTGGVFSDLSSGRSFVPVPESVQIGHDTAIVPISVAAAMEEQEPGGLKAVLSTAGEKVQGAYQTASENVKETYGNLAEASKERQKEFVVGKVASRDVVAEDGLVKQIIVHEGVTITAEQADLAERTGTLGALLAAATGGAIRTAASSVGSAPTSADDVIGRRVRAEVKAPGGSLVAAQGQIVTPAIAERARHLGVEPQLIAATQGGAAQAGAGAGAALAGGVATVSEGASNLLDRAKSWLGERREDAEGALEQRQQDALENKIKDALGRPVNRVILAPDDSIILNVGEIVTHKAVELARAGDVIDILVNSISKETPNIDPLSVRPDEHGKAALESQTDPGEGSTTPRTT